MGALCLWLNWFELAAEIVARLASLEITEDMKCKLDDFIELLESPVFVRVRLQLLDTRRKPALLQTVLRLVALLPQEKTLRARLDVVQTGLLLDRITKRLGNVAQPVVPALSHGASELLARFDTIV